MIRKRPGLYLGSPSITALYHYLHGFSSALDRLGNIGLTVRLLPLPFSYFHSFVANHYDWFESTSGWCNIILQENDLDEEKSLETFFELFDKFMSLSIRQCQLVLCKVEFSNKTSQEKSLIMR